MITYREVRIEDVSGAPWTVAYGWRDTGHLHFAVMRSCPYYSSDELRLACWDSLVASVRGQCDLCGAVAATPPEVKVASPDARRFTARCSMVHRADCPCSDDRLGALDRRDSPDGLGTPPNYSNESTDTLAEFLKLAMEVLV